jgi:hypothetical protein
LFFVFLGKRVLHFHKYLALFLYFLVSTINQMLLHADKGSVLRQDLVLHRLPHHLRLLVHYLRIRHHHLQIRVPSQSLLEQSQSTEVSHTINKRLSCSLGVDLELGSVWETVVTVLISEFERGRGVKLSFESDVKVDELSLEDIGQGLWIGNYTLDQLLIIVQLHAYDDRRESVGQHLDDLLGRVLVVGYEDTLTLSLLCAPQDQCLRTTVANTDGVHASQTVAQSNQSNHTLCIRNCSIGEKEHLSGITFSYFLV